MDYDTLSGADLAYIGDAYYELYIRNYLINKGLTKLYDLHNNSVKFVSCDNQAKIIKVLEKDLTSKEYDVYKRGRNYHYKNKDPNYLIASGFEALVGYLYLSKQLKRLEEIMEKAIIIILQSEG